MINYAIAIKFKVAVSKPPPKNYMIIIYILYVTIFNSLADTSVITSIPLGTIRV
jgi:hypothetical protein